MNETEKKRKEKANDRPKRYNEESKCTKVVENHNYPRTKGMRKMCVLLYTLCVLSARLSKMPPSSE